MFELHVVQAMYGDCQLLVYGQAQDLHYMLIDGGPSTVYGNHLRPVLADIAAQGGRLARVVLTHTDGDHVTGLVDLFADLRGRQLQSQSPLIPVDGVWMNSFALDAVVAPSMVNIAIPVPARFSQEDAFGDPSLPTPAFGVAEAVDLRDLLSQLAIPVDGDFPPGHVTLESASGSITMDGLTLTLIGPTQSNLDRMGREWRAWLQEHRAPEGVAAAPDLAKAVTPDQSIPNRSSIVFVAECEGGRALLTGDARASDIVRGLVRRGLMPQDGVFHVDVLRVPHHGSARNSSRKFFSQVTADTYVFSADGTNGNPDMPTLAWLVQAIKEQGRKARILATNSTPTLDELVREFSPTLYGYDLQILAKGEHILPIRLG